MNHELNESKLWHKLYQEKVARKRREKKTPKKLKKIGIQYLPKEAFILDMCCGTGETLTTLYNYGFRNLYGIDITVSDDILKDNRFQILQGDVCNTNFHKEQFDCILCLHSLHHLEKYEKIENFFQEVFRLLKPNGSFCLIDFPNSIQIRFAFWLFRQKWFRFNEYTRNFGRIINEEWFFLKNYLLEWNNIYHNLLSKYFTFKIKKSGFFYFYYNLKKII